MDLAVIDAVLRHIAEVVVNYRILPNPERRFDWLFAGDVGVKQQLLNHFRQAPGKSLVVEGARVQIAVMLEHLPRLAHASDRAVSRSASMSLSFWWTGERRVRL